MLRKNEGGPGQALHSGDPDLRQFSRNILRFKRLAPSHTIEVRATSSLSRYSDLHASDQLYQRTSQTQPRSPTQRAKVRFRTETLSLRCSMQRM